MNPDDIERLLASDVTLTPSPTFLASVMRAVKRERTALPPLAFPWKRAFPGILALATGLIGGGISVAGDTAIMRMLDEQLTQVAIMVIAAHLHWVALALVVTAVSLVTANTISSSEPDWLGNGAS